MPRIGFAYNQKPESPAIARPEDETPRGDDEPPSSRRDAVASRNSDAPASTELAHSVTVGGNFAAPALPAPADDEFAEWDSTETLDAVANALAALGDVIRLEANADFPQNLRDARPDIVFNIAEGLHGVNREAHVPAICEFYGIPYSASDPYTLSLCLDKARTKEVLAFHGVPTAKFTVIRNEEGGWRKEAERRLASILHPPSSLRLPLFVKPVHEGSSKGITEANYCRTQDELNAQVEFLLERYKQPVLIEEYLPGAEFTCAVLGNGDGARVLPIVGMNFEALPDGALPVYGFEAKWIWDRPEKPLEIFECPARISEELRSTIEDVVLRAYRVLGCRDWSRIDVRLDATGKPNVVEVNPLPGILPNPADNSCFPKAARAAGMSYDELIQACVIHAAERQGVELDVAVDGLFAA